MSILEHESKYPLTTEFIFSECAHRLKKRKLSLKLTDTDIAGDLDRKVVSRIINNTRTRNNAYLIPPAYVKPLVSKLGFHSDYELFWGDAEDEQFIETVFCNLITDILDEWPFWSENSENSDTIAKVLIDDVNYAKIYRTVISSYEYETPEGDYLPILPLAYVNNGEQVSLSGRKKIRQNAILRLFRNTRPIDMFISFFQETNIKGENKGFGKLDSRLDKFVKMSLIPFFKDNMPTQSSLGIRVHTIISSDILNYVELRFINSERTAAGFDSYTSPEYDDILQSLMSAGKEYVNHIEKLQARLDALHRKEKLGRL